MELWPMLLLALGVATAALIHHGAAKAKRASDHLLGQYEKMLSDVRERQNSTTSSEETRSAG